MPKNGNGGGGEEDVLRVSGELITILTNDPTIMETINKFLPNLGKIQAAQGRLLDVLRDVVGGNRAREGELVETRNELYREINMMNSLAILTGALDPTIPQRLGLVTHHPSVKRVVPAEVQMPENFRLLYEGRVLVARASGVKGAKNYELWICDGDPTVESNWKYHTTSGRANRIVITGLTPGKTYHFRIRAITSQGPGRWSGILSMMAV